MLLENRQIRISKLDAARRFESTSLLRNSGIIIGNCRLRCGDLPIKNSNCLKPTYVTPLFDSRKLGHSGQPGIGLHYRALAKERLDGLVWFWIGPHSAYDKFKRTHP